MKVAILADIHANASALKAVLNAVDKEGIKRIYVAGDLIDYYYDAAEVLKMLASYEVTYVRGNHENMLKSYRNHSDSFQKTKYGSGLKIACQNLTEFQLNWLENLSHPLNFKEFDKNVLLSHGSPWDIDTYIYPDADQLVKDKVFSYQADITIMGHSHYAFVWTNAEQIAVNPGSVGQQRDRSLGACWAIWNIKKHCIELRRESYDIRVVEKQVEYFDPDITYLKSILTRDKENH